MKKYNLRLNFLRDDEDDMRIFSIFVSNKTTLEEISMALIDTHRFLDREDKTETYGRNGTTDEVMCQKYGRDWKRYIGIDIACYDEQNKSIPYPIKITTKEMDYDSVEPSLSDPNQGWECDDFEDENDWDDDWNEND